MGRSVGIVVPAYKPPRDALAAYLQRLQRVVRPDQILVELDAPRSGDLVDAIEACGVSVNVSDERRGKGKAIADGFDTLETDVLAFADADGATSPESLAHVIETVRVGADVAAGSRRHPEAEIGVDQGGMRRLLGGAFAWMARRALPVELTDYQCGAKALTRETWRSVRSRIEETGFAWDIELLAMADALGFTVQEVPVEWEDHHETTVSPLDTAVEMAQALVRVRGQARRVAREPVPPVVDALPGDGQR